MDLINRFNKRFFFTADDQGGGGGTPPTPTKPEKTYNQDELNGIIGERLARERSKIYKMLGVEDESGIKDLGEKLAELTTENTTLKTENEAFKNSLIVEEKKAKLIQAGIDEDFVDIAIQKWDDSKPIEDFVKENPKITTAYFTGDFQGTGGSLDGKSTPNEVDVSKLTTEEFMKLSKEGKI